MAYDVQDNFFFMVASERLAASRIYKLYKINRYEMNILASLACYLQLHGKVIASEQTFFKWLGLSYYATKDARSYVYGLRVKGLIKRLEWRSSKGGKCMALSGYGIHILTQFYEQVERIDQQNKDRKQRPGYRSLLIDNSNLPKGYTILEHGRDV
jgi:hypothetical protein